VFDKLIQPFILFIFMKSTNTPNKLISESSPYLLQHAYNPVNWQAWSNDVFKEAKRLNKLVIISVGYSACHWCHVMEHESFEDEQVAELMNKHFICVKVDREERPDVDNLYMTAVQLMTGHGGWPLNCITLPDGRPVYGGTYFNKKQWMNVLRNVAEVYQTEPDKVSDYAANLTSGIKQAELVATKAYPEKPELDEALRKCIQNWKQRFDEEHGGNKKVPKFPMPNNVLFLMRYAHLYQDDSVMKHTHLTLYKMANGGIYDQLHGGFARYSTDGLWKLPHFEKMLYDNAQLISLYSEAYRLSKNRLYYSVITETVDFVLKEWKSPEGGYYSAYDADSEGEEGKYYVWSKEELQEVLRDDFNLFSEYFQVNEVGYWEDGNYILMRTELSAELSAKFQISISELEERMANSKRLLKQRAALRVKPGLDDKIITSWNALMIKAQADAYLATGIAEYCDEAIAASEFLLKHQKKQNGELYRIFKKDQSKIEGFLDDYAFFIDALMAVYSISGNQKYLHEAFALTEIVIERFSHAETDLFYYTNSNYNELLTRQSETSDNVIPSSNSQMALNLLYLSKHYHKPHWQQRAVNLLHMFSAELSEYGSGYSNWGILALHLAKPFYELVIVGKDVKDFFSALGKHYFTNAILVQSESNSDLPLLKGRFTEDAVKAFVCKNNTCGLPVKEVNEVLKLIETS
jgi:uncharacterized protein